MCVTTADYKQTDRNDRHEKKKEKEKKKPPSVIRHPPSVSVIRIRHPYPRFTDTPLRCLGVKLVCLIRWKISIWETWARHVVKDAKEW